MYKGLGLLSSPEKISPKAAPRLQLLVPWESGYRVFFRNLFDLLLFRTVPRVSITSRPARFWHDVFVYTGVPWWAMLESSFWHLLTLLIFLVVYPIWAAHHLDLQRRPLRDSSVIYYKPLPSFPAEGGARSQPRSQPQPQTHAQKRLPQSARPQAAIKVARERSRGAAAAPAAPNVKLRGSRLPNFGESQPVVPPVPSSAIGAARLTVPPDLAAAVAPPPDLAGSGSGRRRMSEPGLAAVAPPPAVPGTSGRTARGREIGIGQARVVGPAPKLPARGQAGAPGGLAGLGGGGIRVVPPPPSINRSGIVTEAGQGALRAGEGGLRVVPPPPTIGGLTISGLTTSAAAGPGANGHGTGFGTGNSQVVPPPPSLNGTGDSSAGGQVASLGGSGSEVVPPPPSLSGAGGAGVGAGAGGRTKSKGGLPNGTPGGFSGAAQVVPPPPSLTGTGGYSGNGAAGLGGGGSQVVPPPPTLAGTGGSGSGSGGRGSSLPGGGQQAVGPPPSLSGTGSFGGGGRGGSLAGGGSQVVPPPPSVETAGNFGGGAGGGSAPDIPSTAAPPPPPPPQPSDTAKAQSGEEVPVRLIGLAFFLPGSSYFSSYEVFIAERRLRKGQTQLIKLVYMFLPYQRRLSEYGLNASGVYKLMVRRDPSCDETLLQMSWHRTSQTEGPDLNSLVGSTASRTQPLPCYRTTADDYRKALKK